MAVRAKFKVVRIERSMGTKYVTDPETGKSDYKQSEIQTVVLMPVSGNGNNDHENTKFWQATPTGEIKLGCVNAEAAKNFKLEGEYYVDFTPAA